MKKVKIIFMQIMFISVSLMFSSCGINSALQLNQNATLTNVTLSNSNFKVIERVKGSATQEYILFIGAMNKTSLYANAKADMMQKANLTGHSKALVNIIAEEHVGGVPPFYMKRTVTYSADVIEFNR